MAHLTKDETATVVALLGGTKVLGRGIDTAAAMQEALRRGLPFAAFESLRKALELPSGELTDILGVASRTLARRKRARQLSAAESDRLYRVAFITRLAVEVLGSLEKARVWLGRPNRALRDAAPVSLLDNEIGERQVEEILRRIEHGIVS